MPHPRRVDSIHASATARRDRDAMKRPWGAQMTDVDAMQHAAQSRPRQAAEPRYQSAASAPRAARDTQPAARGRCRGLGALTLTLMLAAGCSSSGTGVDPNPPNSDGGSGGDSDGGSSSNPSLAELIPAARLAGRADPGRAVRADLSAPSDGAVPGRFLYLCRVYRGGGRLSRLCQPGLGRRSPARGRGLSGQHLARDHRRLGDGSRWPVLVGAVLRARGRND